MAPVRMAGMLAGFATTEMGIVSLVVFLILSITLFALCVKCQKNSGNAYDVNGTTVDGPDQSAWRDHKNMPPSTLERSARIN